MAEITTPIGPILVQDRDVKRLAGLADATGRDPSELFEAAVDKLVNDLVPSTRPPAAERKTRKAKP